MNRSDSFDSVDKYLQLWTPEILEAGRKFSFEIYKHENPLLDRRVTIFPRQTPFPRHESKPVTNWPAAPSSVVFDLLMLLLLLRKK